MLLVNHDYVWESMFACLHVTYNSRNGNSKSVKDYLRTTVPASINISHGCFQDWGQSWPFLWVDMLRHVRIQDPNTAVFNWNLAYNDYSFKGVTWFGCFMRLCFKTKVYSLKDSQLVYIAPHPIFLNGSDEWQNIIPIIHLFPVSRVTWKQMEVFLKDSFYVKGK